MAQIVLLDLIDTLVRLPFKPAGKYLRQAPHSIRTRLRNAISYYYVSDLSRHADFFDVLRDIECQSAVEPDVRDIRQYWESAYDAARFSPGAIEFVDRCRRGGIQVWIASNSLPSVRILIDRLRLRDRVDQIFLSCELGHAKPSFKFFEQILGSQDRTRFWMIGNSIEKDIRPALALGCKVAWYEPGSEALSAKEATWLGYNCGQVQRIADYANLYSMIQSEAVDTQWQAR